MTRELTVPNAVQEAVAALIDPQTPTEDKAAIYSALWNFQLYINRGMRKVKDELITHIVGNDLKALGPLSIKSTAIDVAWPCNAEGNWADATIQDTFRDIIRPLAPEFVRHVPEHYEIRTKELGEAVHAGDPVALQLHAELKQRGWRTEEGRRLSLAVREAKPAKKEAA